MNAETVDEQPRDIASGQFASYRRPTPAGVRQNEGMASFAFPPIFDNADEHLSFFMKAPVSERILSNARFAYSDMMKSDWASWSDARDDAFNQELAVSEKKRLEVDQLKREHGANWRAVLLNKDHEEWLATQGDREMEISPIDIEMVVRAGRAYRTSGTLSEADQEKIDNTRVIISGHGDSEFSMTILELKDYYQTSRWIDDAVMDTDLRVARAMERLAGR